MSWEVSLLYLLLCIYMFSVVVAGVLGGIIALLIIVYYMFSVVVAGVLGGIIALLIIVYLYVLSSCCRCLGRYHCFTYYCVL